MEIPIGPHGGGNCYPNSELKKLALLCGQQIYDFPRMRYFCAVLPVVISIGHLIVVKEIHEDRTKLVAQSKILTDQLMVKISEDMICLVGRITLISAHLD